MVLEPSFYIVDLARLAPWAPRGPETSAGWERHVLDLMGCLDSPTP